MIHRPISMISALAAAVMFAGAGAPHRAPPLVHANDNRTPAGTLHGDTLTLHLIVTMATWRPEADPGPSVEVAAFAEAGKAPEIPAPLIRVRAGTLIVATVRNELPDSTIAVHGLLSRPAAADDSLVLHPGDSATVVFPAGAPGTYLYNAVLGKHDYSLFDAYEREQVGGAFVVDPPGGSPPDRVLVINVWSQPIDSVNDRDALTINGRSWPYTERISATVGDSVRWRVVNASNREHPMHLHGFFYRLTSLGSRFKDSTYTPDAQRMMVTTSMVPFSTLRMAYLPDRPGDWLYHCHIGFHVVPAGARLDPITMASHDRMSDDPRLHMAGLILGIAVRPPPQWRKPARVDPRRMHLFIDQGTPHRRAKFAYGYVLQNGATPPAADSVLMPGSTLVLTRGQPTDVVVVNRLHEKAAIHWHGLELESWSDGVPGWSGMDSTRTAPVIQPGDSFVAHLTLARAGTFIYHTHMNDLAQLTAGLYGAIVVLEPGQHFDPETDHVFIGGWDGPDDAPPQRLLNGDSLPPPLVLRAGVAHRMRFINMSPAGPYPFSLTRDGAVEQWRQLAKDGAELAPNRQIMQPARVLIDVGETYDFEWRPTPGAYELSARPKGKPAFLTQKIVVQ
ncbi:MAG: multicopper oxidase domain-containing protein [Gemmatimonadales bacterium]